MHSGRFEFLSTPLQGLQVIQRKPIEDPRGSLTRLYSAEEFGEAGLPGPIAQINHTSTAAKGTVRGLHFQYPPHAEAKVVSCTRGEVFDVAVDIRTDSVTYLRWHAEILSEKNQKSFLIPEGFAHGYQTLTDASELLYLHTAAYAPDAEGALNPLDEQISIDWPMPISAMSKRDRNHPMLAAGFRGISL